MNRYIGRKSLRAFTLIELLVVIVVIAVLAALLLPVLFRMQWKDRTACCNCNLKQIGLAFRTWSTDNKDKYPMSALTNANGSLEMAKGTNAFRAFQVMANEVNNPLILVCPTDTRRPATDFTNFSNANLSYFVGLDANETFPAMWLAGDRNLMTNGIAIGTGLANLTSSLTITWSGTMHKSFGNVGLSDGSVQEVTSAALQTLCGRTGTNVTRLAIP